MGTAPRTDEIADILRRHLPTPDYQAVLFGSRATGRARPGSDWDIGISGPAPVRGGVLQAIRDDLEDLRTLHRFDVVDLTTVPESFRTRALEHCERLL